MCTDSRTVRPACTRSAASPPSLRGRGRGGAESKKRNRAEKAERLPHGTYDPGPGLSVKSFTFSNRCEDPNPNPPSCRRLESTCSPMASFKRGVWSPGPGFLYPRFSSEGGSRGARANALAGLVGLSELACGPMDICESYLPGGGGSEYAAAASEPE